MVIAERSTVLVVAAHPDDEVLGAGGTIARHADAGDVVQVLIVAEGATSRQGQRDREDAANELSSLAKAAQAAGSILGAAAVELLSLPDNRLDSLDLLDRTKQIALPKLLTFYTHCTGDANIDQRRLSILEVARSTEWKPTGSAPAFKPNLFLDISAQYPHAARLMPLKA